MPASYEITEPYTDIIYSVDEQVATLSFNRPKTLNAFTQHTIYEMEHAFRQAEGDKTVGVIVITGVGERAFSSGGDMHWEADGGVQEEEYNLAHMIVQSPKPVIARVNGYAIGGGNHLVYFCDITIAAEHAIFGQNGPRVGSPASGYMVSQSANIVGHKRARELWLLCRRYTAQQMYQWGMVNAVVPMEKLDEEVRKWANEMLSLSPSCLKVIKASFAHHMRYIMDKEMAEFVDEYAPGYYDTGEQQEGAQAFLEKRTPNFNRWR